MTDRALIDSAAGCVWHGRASAICQKWREDDVGRTRVKVASKAQGYGSYPSDIHRSARANRCRRGEARPGWCGYRRAAGSGEHRERNGDVERGDVGIELIEGYRYL